MNLTNKAVLALGSNLGQRDENLHQALRLLKQGDYIRVLNSSKVYENRAVGLELDAGDFLNMACLIETTCSPEELLERCLQIELEMGRDREQDSNIEGKRSRIIDIDIILFNDLRLSTDKLKIPHPDYRERDFVVLPMQDLNIEGLFNIELPIYRADLVRRRDLN